MKQARCPWGPPCKYAFVQSYWSLSSLHSLEYGGTEHFHTVGDYLQKLDQSGQPQWHDWLWDSACHPRLWRWQQSPRGNRYEANLWFSSCCWWLPSMTHGVPWARKLQPSLTKNPLSARRGKILCSISPFPHLKVASHWSLMLKQTFATVHAAALHILNFNSEPAWFHAIGLPSTRLSHQSCRVTYNHADQPTRLDKDGQDWTCRVARSQRGV